MRWTPPARAASDVPDWRCIRHQSKRGGVRDEGYYCGVGPGKAGVLGARGGRAWQGGAEEAGLARQAPGAVRAAALEPGRDGGLLGGASLGARAGATRPPGGDHGAALRGALSQEPEERRQRCRGDLRGGEPAEHAARAGEERRAARTIGAAPRAPGAHGRAHRGDQSAAWASGRVRHRAAQGALPVAGTHWGGARER